MKRSFERSAATAGQTTGLAALLLCAAASVAVADDVPFLETVVDPAIAGDCKMAGDIDGDGFPDLVIGGMPEEGLNWYRYPTWRKTAIAVPEKEFTTDGALGDVDGDGDLDIVVPDGDGSNNLKWFRNPLPQGDPSDGAQWREEVVGSIGGWGKDIELADFDGDGRLDIAARHAEAAMVFFQAAPGRWVQVPMAAGRLGHEGMASGDVDGDGDVDLVLRGTWVENPGGTAATRPGGWREHVIGEAPDEFKALTADVNGDGVVDVLFSSSEGVADVQWWTPATGDPRGTWVARTIVPAFERGHTLQAADMDNDGDVDVVLGQMHTSADKRLLVLRNLDGRGEEWSSQTVATGGIHDGVVVDVDKDGDVDIYGANWTGNPPVRLWVNRTVSERRPLPLDRWGFHQITDRGEQTFGLGFGDVDGDGLDDVVAGRHVWLNPGGDMTGAWADLELPRGMHGFATLDVDADGRAEVIAQKSEDDLALYRLAWKIGDAPDWTAQRLGSVPSASHDLGAQGYRLAQLEPGSLPEIAISSGGGIFYFVAPAGATAGEWRRVHVSGDPSDEGFGVGDVDGDGALDIAATTGESKGVEWYRNPGDGSDGWTAWKLGDFPEAVYPDRTELADLDGDGRLDVVVTEENGEGEGAETYWWGQPPAGADAAWPRHLLTTQATTNSLDVADLDGDGRTDVVTGEHRGAKRVILWKNRGDGTFSPLEIDRGHESHLGVRIHDLDGDGDLDIVSIAYDDGNVVWLWRNDAVRLAGLNVRVAERPATSTPWLVRVGHLLKGLVN